jgi:hypothetical protein
MPFEEARAAILNYLQSTGRAKNSDLLGLVGGNRELFDLVREDLIHQDLALDNDSVSLVYCGAAGTAQTPVAEPTTDTPKIFLSYGRRDAAGLADRLYAEAGEGKPQWRMVDLLDRS